MNSRRTWLPLMALLAALIAPRAACAQAGDFIQLSTSQLQALGIKDGRLLPSVFSRDGNMLLAIEKQADPRMKAQGKVWMLHVFRLDWNGHKTTCDTMYLPTTSLEQSALSPDGRQLLAISDAGTRLIAVDLQNMSARIVFRHEPGKPGFRCYPEVEWFENGAFHVVGYYYDAEGIAHGDAIAAVSLQGSGVAAIQQVHDVSKLMKQVSNFAIGQWYDDEEAYFGGLERDRKIHLKAYYGDTVTPLDVALGYGGMAVGQDRVIYVARWEEHKYGAVVQDLAEKKRWTVGDPAIIYSYPYMSEDGTAILLSRFSLADQKMTTWYGREQNHFHLEPVPGLQDVRPGTIRFDKNGDVLSFYNLDGLRFIRLPSK